MNVNKRIKSIEERFTEYKEKVYPYLLNHIEENQSDFEDLFVAFYQLYLLSAFMLDTQLKQIESDQKQILNFYLRSSISIHGIYHLCRNGIITNAALSLRSMFEDVIYLKIILEEDTENRLKLYTDYDKVNKWLYLKNLQKYGDNKKRKTNLDYDKTKSDFEKIKDKYHPKNPYQWYWQIYNSDDNKEGRCNLVYLCRRLNWIEEYYTIYSTTSLVSHGSNISKKLYQSKNSITLAPIFYKLKLSTLVGLGAFYFSQVACDTLDFFKINSDVKLYILVIERNVQKICKE